MNREKERETKAGLATEAVERTALALERVDNIERRDRLALGVLRVRDGVADDAFEERLQHATRLFVDHGRDTLDTTTTRETADGGLRDALDVVAKDLAVTLGATLAKALATFTASSHFASVSVLLGGQECRVVVGLFVVIVRGGSVKKLG